MKTRNQQIVRPEVPISSVVYVRKLRPQAAKRRVKRVVDTRALRSIRERMHDPKYRLSPYFSIGHVSMDSKIHIGHAYALPQSSAHQHCRERQRSMAGNCDIRKGAVIMSAQKAVQSHGMPAKGRFILFEAIARGHEVQISHIRAHVCSGITCYFSRSPRAQGARAIDSRGRCNGSQSVCTLQYKTRGKYRS